MDTEVAKKLFTVDDYYRMAEVGILSADSRVELIHGEIVQMCPIGDPHAIAVDRGNNLLAFRLHERAIVRVQNPLRLGKYDEPQPDIVLLKYRADFYKSRKPGPDDALLLIEVSDSTLRYDRRVKLPLYASAGIAEVWIEDIRADRILVHREPLDDKYQTSLTVRRGESISIAAFPDLKFKVEDFLG